MNVTEVNAADMAKDLARRIINLEDNRGDPRWRLYVEADDAQLQVEVTPGVVRVEVNYKMFLSGGAEAYWRKVLWRLNLTPLRAGFFQGEDSRSLGHFLWDYATKGLQADQCVMDENWNFSAIRAEMAVIDLTQDHFILGNENLMVGLEGESSGIIIANAPQLEWNGVTVARAAIDAMPIMNRVRARTLTILCIQLRQMGGFENFQSIFASPFMDWGAQTAARLATLLIMFCNVRVRVRTLVYNVLPDFHFRLSQMGLGSVDTEWAEFRGAQFGDDVTPMMMDAQERDFITGGE